jgi:hypothetical protein
MNERNKINIWLRSNGIFGRFDGIMSAKCCECAESLWLTDKPGYKGQ